MKNFIPRNNISFLESIVFFGLFALIDSDTDVNITVFRSSTKLNQTLINSHDKFNISSRECGNNVDLCKTFGGVKTQENCRCTCSEDRSTFGLYNKEWKCTKNSIVRQHAGCSYYLTNLVSNVQNTPLYTLPVLGPGGDNNYVNGIPKNATCTFLRNKASFLKCDGTWGQLDNKTLDVNTLTLQRQQQGKHLYVGPYKPSKHDSLEGKLIRIPIECSGLPWTPSQCVALKLKGNLNCLMINHIVSNIPSTEPTTTATATATTTTSAQVIITTQKKEPTPANLTTVIAGSVAGGAGLVILIIFIIALVVCLRRRRAKKAKNSQAARARAQDNMAYETSMTMSKPNGLRPLPEVPGWPYSSLQRGPSSTIHTPNGTMATKLESSTPNTLTPNNEPLYGTIDDENNYSRLDHTKQTIPIDSPLRNSYLHQPHPNHMNGTLNKSGTLMSTGSNFSGFVPYDVVEGRIGKSLPRRDSTFLYPDDGSGLGYDVPEGVLKDTLERSNGSPGIGFLGPSIFKSMDRKTLEQRKTDNIPGESYEAVWDNRANDELVTKIELD